MREPRLGGKSCPNSADLSNSPRPSSLTPHPPLTQQNPYRGGTGRKGEGGDISATGFRFRSNDERSYFLAHFGVTARIYEHIQCAPSISSSSRHGKKFVAPRPRNLISDFKSDFLDTRPRSFRDDDRRDEKLLSRRYLRAYRYGSSYKLYAWTHYMRSIKLSKALRENCVSFSIARKFAEFFHFN